MWAKDNLAPSAPPGKKAYHTGTNYHLLGLIVEKVSGEPFPAVLQRLVTPATLAIMKGDKLQLNPGFEYGYGIWHVRPAPLLLPAKPIVSE